MATLPTDPVIDRLAAALATARDRYQNAKLRRDRVAGAVVDARGNVRHGYALETAARDVELDALATRVASAERALEAAVADLPRREKERSTADALEREVAVAEARAEELRAALAKLDGELANRRARIALHRRRAEHSEAELAHRGASVAPPTPASLAAALDRASS